MEEHPYYRTSGLNRYLNIDSEIIVNEGFRNGGIWYRDTRTIVVGTFPPKKEHLQDDGQPRKGYVHYSSPKNKFWRHIDNIQQTQFYVPSRIANVESLRIENALSKVNWLKENKLGFIDIFTKVNRKAEGSHADADLIEVETIFATDIFKELLYSSVERIVFVYKLARETFLVKVKENYNSVPEIVREYKKDDLPLEVMNLIVDNKNLLLCYCPIHGKIPDANKRDALKQAIEL